MKETDLAWLAGIIDGEGSIFIMEQGRKDRERTVNYILRMAVQSVDPYMTALCKEISGEGSCWLNKRDYPNCSDTLKWQVDGKGCVRVLEKIRPYLRVKHEQADLAIEFQKTTKKHWRHMRPEDYKRQKELCEQMRQAKTDLKVHKSLREAA